ncbi:EI24 domain-containing protein [Helicobacter pylori]|uniref:EI24 domain-containing protein n=1 Tax=Helicobacter pylori TaxID=210 RepID=UPI00287B5E65|nr:EI24 domain-containing protein [Helicobacter pylori]WNE32774.1 EI24 domain-containing protein [Helicobacter pylori]WNE34203.1 EI24 domain-containing protein [Helicobacter pylori]WNE35629.1 EI24 domain-containing protein [Helicobacter pylori]WNE37055.1 EI24 domain-containing protein [Helicobacter pylori]WNE38482.1 EI24 domain-containing protein [Helicobacter pylori]
MVLFLSIFKKSFNDFLSTRMLLINLGPILLSLAFFGAIFYYNGGSIVNYCQALLPQSLSDYSHSQGFFAGVFVWVFKALVYFLIFWIVILLSLVINIFASIFYTPLVVSYLHQKYYPHVVLEEFGSILFSIKYFLRSLIFMLLFLAVLTPLYFIPFIGVFGVFFSIIAHFLFFKNTMSLDIASMIFNHQSYQNLLKQHRLKHYRFSFFCYLLSLIPFFNFFATLLQTLMLTHYFFILKEKEC